MGRYAHISQLLSFFGLDLRSSELTRPRGFLSDGSQDFMHSPQGAMKTRYGSKIFAGTNGYTGLVRFDTTNMAGVSKTELIGFGGSSLNNSDSPYKLVRNSFVLTNSHATDAATVSHYYDEATSQFRFKIVRTTTLIDQGLGVGTEGSPYMLSSLETAVDALTSFAMSTPTSASTTPSAFMELIADATVAANGGTLTVYYYLWEALDSVTGSDLVSMRNFADEIGNDSYRNVSTAIVRGVLYCSPGNVWTGNRKTVRICKYDGQNFYIAGFPNEIQALMNISTGATGATPVASNDSKGDRSVTNALTGTYTYGYQLVKIDAAGNRVESPLYRETLAALAGTYVRVDFATSFLIAADFGLESGIANGAQTGVLTITVSSHSLTVGSIGYFWDNNQSRFIQREITAQTSTTITISTDSLDSNSSSINYDAGGAVNILDDAIITNNYRLVVYRSMAGGSELYLNEERPVGAGGFFYDDLADADLGGAYVEPQFPLDAPPSGRYLCSFNDQLIIAGNDRSPNTVYFSDTGPEYFPRDTHSFDLTAAATGVRQSGEVLVCGTQNSLSVVAGDLLNFAFRVSKVGDNIGVTAHASMQEAMEGVLMFSSYKGPYVLTGGRDLRPLGAMELRPGVLASRLEPYWTQLYGPTEDKPVFERAVAAVLPKDSLYVLFVPVEDPDVIGHATSASVAFVYNYARDAWYKWTGVNMAGGIAVLDDALVWTARGYDGSGGAGFANVSTSVNMQQRRKGKYNFADHATAITWRIRSHWESLGRANFFKRFLRIKIRSDETREASTTAMTLKTYVDYDTSKLSTTDTLSFTTEKALRPKIKGETCQSMQFVFESSAYYQPMHISGYEIEAVADFRPEMKE